MLLCEPNISEGRDAARMDRFAAAVASTPGIALLHRSADPDHHRMVLAYVGEAEAILAATRGLAAEVFAHVDLREHAGAHPRTGALDVVPLVPLGRATEAVALETCRAFGGWVGARGVPVLYYEEAATSPDRRPLPSVRAGGFEGLPAKLARPEWRPDEGPSRPHPSVGIVIAGVRGPLIRFNVNLRSSDPEPARAIAARVRAAGGGLPGVRALGFALPTRNLTQVSMNLTRYRETSIEAAFERVAAEARARGVGIAGVELIGPVPADALGGRAREILGAALDETQVLPFEDTVPPGAGADDRATV